MSTKQDTELEEVAKYVHSLERKQLSAMSKTRLYADYIKAYVAEAGRGTVQGWGLLLCKATRAEEQTLIFECTMRLEESATVQELVDKYVESARFASTLVEADVALAAMSRLLYRFESNVAAEARVEDKLSRITGKEHRAANGNRQDTSNH